MDLDSLKKLDKLCSFLMEHQQVIAIPAVRTLLQVAMRHPEPTEQADLHEKVGIEANSTSRHLAYWGQLPPRYNTGAWPAMLALDPSPEDRRHNLATLTPDGVKFLNKLLKTIES